MDDQARRVAGRDCAIRARLSDPREARSARLMVGAVSKWAVAAAEGGREGEFWRQETSASPPPPPWSDDGDG